VLELHGGSARSPVLGRDRDTNGCYANDDQLQAVTHIMTHRPEYSRAGPRSAWKFGRTIDNDIAVIIAALRCRASSETSIGRLHDDNLVCRDARFEHSPLSFCKCSRPSPAALVIVDDETP
jgi:hypothetical protein